MEAVDLGAVYFFSTHRMEWLNTLMVAITTTGNFQVLLPMSLVLALVLFWQRGSRTGGIFMIAAVVTCLATYATQEIVARPRPDVFDKVIPTPTVPSFPSGHTSNSLLIYGLFGLLLTRTWPSSRRRMGVVVPLFLLAFLIGFTRLYLAVHFVSDVLGGWVLGLGILLCAYGADHVPPTEPSSR